jgi:hypothetical protein
MGIADGKDKIEGESEFFIMDSLYPYSLGEDIMSIFYIIGVIVVVVIAAGYLGVHI